MYRRQASLRQRPAALITWSGRPTMAAVVAAPILKLCPTYESQLCMPDADSMVRTWAVKTERVRCVPLARTNRGADDPWWAEAR